LSRLPGCSLFPGKYFFVLPEIACLLAFIVYITPDS
jgi:hypothetical protein